MEHPLNRYYDKIQPIIKSLPDSPGVYRYYDEQGQIIYVGKAKSLKKRVSSYFNRDVQHSGKIKVLVAKIADIQVIVVDTEIDALLLENNLIKKYQPRYNALLKDDKTFPWICIKNEPFPRIFSTRNHIRDGSRYYGPYASGKMMHALLDLIRHLFQYRTCRLQLSPENIKAGKFKVCLEYHIGNCKGPCEGLQSAEDYEQTISQVVDILKGNLSSVTQQLKELMASLASGLEFEKAQLVKEKINLLENYQSKSLVVHPSIHNVDVFSFYQDSSSAYVNFMKVVSGAIVQSHTMEYRKKLDETEVEILEMAIGEMRQNMVSHAREVLLPFDIELEIPGVEFVVPIKGDKKKLLELSERNAKYFHLEKQKQKDLVDPERHTKRILERMQADLHLQAPPLHIECFDNSNTQGTYPVAALVVFKNARASKKDYRHFNIKTVEGPNDFASMEEVVYRRYKRMMDENQELPNLVIVDGGKGQLSSAIQAFEKLSIRGKVPIIGIAKRLEEIYFPGDTLPLYLDKKSETLKIIQQLRDEAHRFGITHHRKRRQKGSMSSILDDIQGIGPRTKQSLLEQFHSVAGIEKASLDELEKTIGKAKAVIIFDFFAKKKG